MWHWLRSSLRPGLGTKEDAAVVVKGLDKPVFTVLGDGCASWKRRSEVRVHLPLHGPGLERGRSRRGCSSSRTSSTKGVAGIAISPSNAPAMANMLKATAEKMTDHDDRTPNLAVADRSLRKTYLGTNNYDMGGLMAKH